MYKIHVLICTDFYQKTAIHRARAQRVAAQPRGAAEGGHDDNRVRTCASTFVQYRYIVRGIISHHQ